MQTIITKYMPATNTKPSRIMAYASGYSKSFANMRIIRSWNHELDNHENHKVIAFDLIQRLDWKGTWYSGSNEGDRGYVWVCKPKDDVEIIEYH